MYFVSFYCSSYRAVVFKHIFAMITFSFKQHTDGDVKKCRRYLSH
jgi:hypothetical protein